MVNTNLRLSTTIYGILIQNVIFEESKLGLKWKRMEMWQFYPRLCFQCGQVKCTLGQITCSLKNFPTWTYFFWCNTFPKSPECLQMTSNLCFLVSNVFVVETFFFSYSANWSFQSSNIFPMLMDKITFPPLFCIIEL